MEIIQVNNKIEGGAVAFHLIKEAIESKKAQVLGLATGSTPETLYQKMVESDLDFSNLVSINLDEYVGLSNDDKQSYHYFMKKNLFDAKPFKQSYLPNGLATQAAEECERYNQIIEQNPVDIQILGLGENAHIGFNEPGSSFEAYTSEVSLTESTIKANSRNFKTIEEVPTKAYSMGIGSILKAKKIILMAYGPKKAQAVYDMINGPITEAVPASILQKHADVTIIIDSEAASKL